VIFLKRATFKNYYFFFTKEGVMMMEPLFEEPENKYIVNPESDGKYKDLWEMYLKAKRSFWVDEEIDLSRDLVDWITKLTDVERDFILVFLAFFVASDVIVNQNIEFPDFMDKIKVVPVKLFYRLQLAMEDIHSQTYTKIITTLLKNDDKKMNYYLNGLQNFECLKKKAEWSLKWTKEGTFAQRIVAFAIVEGIFFSSSFCCIYWLKKRGLMHGLTFSNELISRDEGLHRDEWCLLYRKYLLKKPHQNEVHQMIKEAVDVEIGFVNEALKIDLLGMNKTLMSQYVKYIADHLLVTMELPKLFNVQNPFDWMNLISLQTLPNFFERQVSNYSKVQSSPQETFKILENF
jgi:ribonucleoside-diphosphate reductase beta chain